VAGNIYRRSQWRHIDPKAALFAQSGGGKATLFRIKEIRSRRRRQGGGAANALPKANIARRVQPSRHVRFAPKDGVIGRQLVDS
jgi:hypothetical protein